MFALPRDRGDTLIELVVAIAIMGIAVVTLLTGFLNLTASSSRQSAQSQVLAALASTSEYVKTRSCGATCPAVADVDASLVPQTVDAAVSISAPTTAVCCGAPLVQYAIAVTVGSTSFTNTVVVSP